jgi:hypothetical protein
VIYRFTAREDREKILKKERSYRRESKSQDGYEGNNDRIKLVKVERCFGL